MRELHLHEKSIIDKIDNDRDSNIQDNFIKNNKNNNNNYLTRNRTNNNMNLDDNNFMKIVKSQSKGNITNLIQISQIVGAQTIDGEYLVNLL